MNKFKIGDRVKIITACSSNNVGEEYVVSNMSKRGTIDGNKIWAGSCYCKEKWELIEPQVEPQGLTINSFNCGQVINSAYEKLSQQPFVVWNPKNYWEQHPIFQTNYQANFISKEQNKLGIKHMLNVLTNQIKRLLSPSKQRLYRAGYIGQCGELTTEGREELTSILLDANEDAMVKLAEEKIAEEEKKHA